MTDTMLKTHFQAIEDKLNAAYESNDAVMIDALLADDWTMLEPAMGLVSKSSFLTAISNGSLQHSRMKKEVLQVKLYNDMAIVITKGNNEGYYAGKSFNAEHWVTNTYRKEGQQWLCVMTQEAAVSCP